MVNIKKSIASKLLWMILAFVIFYIIGDSLHIIPQSVKDLIDWGASNFELVVFLICFVLVVSLIRTFKKNKGASQQ